MLQSFFTIPSATTTIAQAYEAGNPYFQALLPILYVASGLFIGVMAILFIINIVSNVIDRFSHTAGDDLNVGMLSGGVRRKDYYKPINWNPDFNYKKFYGYGPDPGLKWKLYLQQIKNTLGKKK